MRLLVVSVAICVFMLGSAIPVAAAAPSGFSCSIGKGGYLGRPGGAEWVDFIKFCTSFGGHPKPF